MFRILPILRIFRLFLLVVSTTYFVLVIVYLGIADHNVLGLDSDRFVGTRMRVQIGISGVSIIFYALSLFGSKKIHRRRHDFSRAILGFWIDIAWWCLYGIRSKSMIADTPNWYCKSSLVPDLLQTTCVLDKIAIYFSLAMAVVMLIEIGMTFVYRSRILKEEERKQDGMVLGTAATAMPMSNEEYRHQQLQRGQVPLAQGAYPFPEMSEQERLMQQQQQQQQQQQIQPQQEQQPLQQQQQSQYPSAVPKAYIPPNQQQQQQHYF